MDEDETKAEYEAYRRRRNFLIDVERIAPHPKDGTEWLLNAAGLREGD